MKYQCGKKRKVATKMTRNEYLNTKNPFHFNSLEGKQFSNNLHNEYYSQFITEATKSIAKDILKKHSFRGIYKINESLKHIQLGHWDMAAIHLSDLYFNAKAWKECEYIEWHKIHKGQISIDLASKVSMLKCAARMILQKKGWKEHWEIVEGGHWDCFLVKEKK